MLYSKVYIDDPGNDILFFIFQKLLAAHMMIRMPRFSILVRIVITLLSVHFRPNRLKRKIGIDDP